MKIDFISIMKTLGHKPHIEELELNVFRMHYRLKIRCTYCDTVKEIWIPEHEFEEYVNGACIQDAMKSLQKDDRELITSGICPKCWEQFFGGEDEHIQH